MERPFVRSFTDKERKLAGQLHVEFEAMCPLELVNEKGFVGTFVIEVRKEAKEKNSRLYFENGADGLTFSLSFLQMSRHFLDEMRKNRPYRRYNDDKHPHPYPFKIERSGGKTKIVPETGWFIRATR